MGPLGVPFGVHFLSHLALAFSLKIESIFEGILVFKRTPVGVRVWSQNPIQVLIVFWKTFLGSGPAAARLRRGSLQPETLPGRRLIYDHH